MRSSFILFIFPRFQSGSGSLNAAAVAGGITHSPRQFQQGQAIFFGSESHIKTITEGGREERGRSICTVLYQTDVDDLPEDFLIDVVELDETYY